MIQAVQNQALKQRIGRGYFLQISVVFVAYLVAGKLGQATANIRSSNLGPVWPAYGIALAAILICGYRVWLGVAAGAFVVAFFSPVSHVAALGQAAGATLAATTGAFLLHRIANFRPSLTRLSDVLSLIAFGGFGSAIVSASIGVSVLYATRVHAYSGLGAAWLIYWLGDATGVLLVTPLALRFTDFSKLRDRDRIAELAILLLLLSATCFVIFSDLSFFPVKLDVMAFSVLPFITWAAIRFGVGVTALSILIVAAIATIESALGSGPFASNTTFVNAVLLDVFFGVLSVSGLSLAAVIAERENAEREREQVVSKQAAMEARLRADEALRESEDKLRLLLDSTAEAIYGIDLEHRCTFCNPACLRTLGYERIDQVLGKNMHDLLHHSRADGTLFPVEECRVHRVTQTGEGVHAAGEVFWRANETSFPTEYWSYPQRRGQELVGAVVAFIDITERKLAEAALADVSRRLIEAHEQERTRIGRDLHDDVVQRLAFLAIELEAVQTDVPDSVAELGRRIGDLRNQTTQITNDVQLLSHELHSSRLEYLGIVGAAKNFCKEFGERQKLEIDFQSHDLPTALPNELSLSLFRVLQEALRNATKHSGVKRFEVRLWGSPGAINLTISDLGAGFDQEAAMKSTGLGLTSMQERLRLVGGELSINSQPKGGTTIHARVPFDSSSNSARAAG